MSLKDIFCQDKALSILCKGFTSGKDAHAFIFSGINGVGKSTTANQYAKLLLCDNPKVDNDVADSCGKCQSCKSFDTGSHPDFVHIYKELLEFTKDGRNKTTPVDLSIDVIREFLIEVASKKPTLSKRKVFVVSEAEKLNNSSQNALLKVLEEPPVYCCIILLCTRLEKLLPTTKSRCRIIQFGRIDEDIITSRISDLGLDAERSTYFARLADGSIGRAFTYAKLELESSELFKMKCDLIKTLSTFKYDQALDCARSFINAAKSLTDTWSKIESDTSDKDIKRKATCTILEIVISALRDAMKLNMDENAKLINADQKQIIAKLAKKFDPELAAKKISDCYRCIRYIEASVNEKLLFEQLLLNLADSATIKT
ncbi:MAG: AAA family ATPase [Sedimentisphaerales bacterium]|nr:AAA family ATPase [Sedimentisphaerales bacterium]